MNFVGRVVRFLVWLLVVSWSVWLARRIVAWVLRDAIGAPPQSRTVRNAQDAEVPGNSSAVGARRLVRDPVCGMHVDEVLAIPLRDGDEVVHFCSIACRDKYMGRARKFAARG